MSDKDSIKENLTRDGNRQVISVSDLNRQVRYLLEDSLPLLYVEGEISNLARPASGHMYFSLKDDKAQLRCAMFRNRGQHLRFRPRDGMQVIVRGRVSLYEGRGEFQMIAEEMEESGEGVLRRAFEKLKQKLAAEGLFEESRKQALPVMPAHIGIITSPTGAAIRDVLHVLQRRFPAIGVSILPVQVQGEESPAQIVRAIEMANRYQTDSLIAPDPFLGPFSGPFDVLLLTRGGGSLEDLWAFNTEQVARAIAASGLPVISAVGHETDFSIADFVADLRAPTPSAAAEMLSPDQTEWKQTFGRYALHLTRLMREKLQNAGQQQGHLSRRLRNPVHKLQGYQQQADGLEMRLQRSAKQQVARLQMQLNLQRTRLASPVHQLNRLNESLRQRQAGLISGLQSSLKGKQNALGMVVQKMNALSPLATLERGYAIVTKGEGLTQVIKSSEEVNPGDRIHARLRRGTIVAEVKSTLDDT